MIPERNLLMETQIRAGGGGWRPLSAAASVGFRPFKLFFGFYWRLMFAKCVWFDAKCEFKVTPGENDRLPRCSGGLSAAACAGGRGPLLRRCVCFFVSVSAPVVAAAAACQGHMIRTDFCFTMQCVSKQPRRTVCVASHAYLTVAAPP